MIWWVDREILLKIVCFLSQSLSHFVLSISSSSFLELMLSMLNVKTEKFVYIYFKIKPLARFHLEVVPF